MEILFIWIACGVFAAIVASSKGRSGFGWLILGVLFGIFALIAAAGLPKLEPSKAQPSLADSKVCPECAETIKAAANVCRYCGHRFEEVPVYDKSYPDPNLGMRESAQKVSKPSGLKGPWIAVLIIVVVGALFAASKGKNSSEIPTSSSDMALVALSNREHDRCFTAGVNPPICASVYAANDTLKSHGWCYGHLENEPSYVGGWHGPGSRCYTVIPR